MPGTAAPCDIRRRTRAGSFWTSTARDCPSLKKSKSWYHLERLANLPLGILEPIEYEQFAIHLEFGDVVLLYTDAIPECADAAGELLGEAGLKVLVESLAAQGIDDLGPNLLSAVDRRRDQNAAADDQTVILVKRSEGPLPRQTVVGTVRTLAKMIGLPRFEPVIKSEVRRGHIR